MTSLFLQKNTKGYDEQKPFLQKDRVQEIETFKSEKMRAQMARASVLLDYALRQSNIDCDLPPMVCKTSSGKPYIKNCKIHISYSHCDEHILCALSDRQIGADIEMISSNLLQISHKILSPFEKKYYDQLLQKDKPQYLCHKWTQKESLAKFTGEGIRKHFFGQEIFGADIYDGSTVYENKTIYFYSYSFFDCCASIVCLDPKKPQPVIAL